MTLTVDGPKASYTLSVTGLTGLTQSHIHNAAAGANGPVNVFLWDGPAAGTTQDSPFTYKSDFSNFTAAGCTPNCTIQSFDAIVGFMELGTAYVNVHTTANPGGAIRGQLVKSS